MLRGLIPEEDLGIDSKVREGDREALEDIDPVVVRDKAMEEAQGICLSLVKEAQEGIPSLAKQGIQIKEIQGSFLGIEEMIDQGLETGLMVNS